MDHKHCLMRDRVSVMTESKTIEEISDKRDMTSIP